MFSKSSILESSLQMITIMKSGPHIFGVVSIYHKNWVPGARWKQLGRLAIHKMKSNHVRYKNTSWKLANPAEIESFLKIGTDLTTSGMSHLCGSRFHKITPCPLKDMELSHAYRHWSLDRLCFVRWNEEISENDTQKCWLNSNFHPICLRASALYWGYQRCTSGYQC